MNKFIFITTSMLIIGSNTIGQVVRPILEHCEPYYTVFERNGKYGVKHTETDKVVTPAKYEAISLCVAFNAKFGKAKKNGKWAVIEKNGKRTTRFEYEEVKPVPEDFDELFLMASPEPEKWVLIGNSGKPVSKKQYDEIIRPYRALFEVRLQDLWGVIDTAGTEAVPVKYDGVSFLSNDAYAVEKDGKQGIIFIGDGDDIPLEYEVVGNVRMGFCGYKNGQYQLFNRKGQELGIKDLEWVGYYGSIYNDDEILVKKHGKYGLIRIDKGWVVPARYDSIQDYLNYHLVTLDSLYGLYGKNGDLIFPATYNNFRVSNKDFIVKRKDKMGVIGQDGNEIIPVIHDQVIRLVNRRTHGLDYTYGILLDSTWVLAYPNGQVIDSLRFGHLKQIDNKIIIATKGEKKYIGEFDGSKFKFYYNFPLDDFGSVGIWLNTYSFRKNGKVGIMNIHSSYSHGNLPGRIIRQPEFDSIYFDEGNQYLVTVKNGKLGLMSREGKDILPCNYDEVVSFAGGDAAIHHYVIIRNDQEELKVSYYGKISRIDEKSK